MSGRQQIQQVYIRVCRDSGFQLDYLQAANLAAKVLGKHPLDVWIAMPCLDVMREIAVGEHPAARRSPAASMIPTSPINEGRR
ncbi:MAG: hypothetical protein JWN66_4995 [Sphingomonas bacterium]|nr:hypothetical protein [Sphingomonas bacterium]